MNRDEEFLAKRIIDLADQSYRTGLYTYTGFLNQQEQAVYDSVRKDATPVKATLFGGVEGCERQVLRFGDEESLGYDAGFPICCIEIRPLIEKFSDALTHRDYLGALMHLGIDRSTLGDIMIRDKTAYLFCLDKMASFIVDNLDQVKHTHVKCRLLEEMPEAVRPQLQAVKLIVPSMRLDVVIAKLYHLSRSQSIALFHEKKIFVNGRGQENNSGILTETDVVSVRGHGKFICDGISGETKKGNLNIQVSKYV